MCTTYKPIWMVVTSSGRGASLTGRRGGHRSSYSNSDVEHQRPPIP